MLLFLVPDCSECHGPPFNLKKLAHLASATQPNDSAGGEKARMEEKKQRHGNQEKRKEYKNDNDKQNNMEAASANASMPRVHTWLTNTTVDAGLPLSEAEQHTIG